MSLSLSTRTLVSFIGILMNYQSSQDISFFMASLTLKPIRFFSHFVTRISDNTSVCAADSDKEAAITKGCLLHLSSVQLVACTCHLRENAGCKLDGLMHAVTLLHLKQP